MRVSLAWLKELIDVKASTEELANTLSLTSIGVKTTTPEYIELDLTYNRGDLLSLRGVARELAAVTGSKVLFTPANPLDYPWQGKQYPEANIKVENAELSPVYCLAKIEGLKTASSNPEWVNKLAQSGIRTVSNLADITNLVMVEYGQPMHAFDADKLTGSINVRLATKDENLLTLDNKKRKLDPEDLVIADEKGPLAIAGIMGGKESEVSEPTNTILLEAAIFDPVSNRKSSKRHGLYSEASKRFQHGLCKTNLLDAFAAAINAYQELGGKLISISLVGNLEDQPKEITLTQKHLNNLLGVSIEPEFVTSSLEKLGFKVTGTGEGWIVTPPVYRLDINLEEDVIEEVARMYGYEKIEGKALKEEKIPEIDQSFYNFLYDLKVACKEAGLTEVQTYSFYEISVLNTFNLDTNNLIKIANPISAETEYLRQDLWPNLVEVASRNIRKGQRDIAIFELGKIYFINEKGLPDEKYRLSILLIDNTDNPVSELCSILRKLYPQKAIKFEVTRSKDRDSSGQELYHPNRFAQIFADGQAIGNVMEVHKRYTDSFGTKNRIAVLELELNNLV
ncbi:MAG: phenylalanine--tRNA ligase subunit beta [Candidatus Daviesbacteria bacterium]|nr:phenylalanine--tRNA ligase subunit beta [Candidatus Daviesbacteria bacterium]